MPTNYNRANLITESATLFPDNNTQLISPADLRSWLEDGTTSFVTQKDKSTLENAIFENKASTLASGATVDLNTATGNYLHISGTSTINSFGTCPAGARFIIVFDAAATLTYNATSLIIPGLANKTAAAGDCCMIVSEGSGNWRIVGYFAISGGGGGGSVTAVTGTAPIASSGGTAPDISIPQANGSTDGYLSSTDWNTFDGKGIGTITALTGDVTASGTGSVVATIANGAVDIAMLSATGTPSATTFLRGDNTWATPSGGGGGSGGGASVNYYLNGSVSQGTFGGVACKEINRTPIFGAGTDFTINANGYIQSFITDANDPNQLLIPPGNWTFENYFSASSGGGSPSFYPELYKWDGATLTLIASNSATPESITGGTSIDLYVTALAVPSTVLAATDRLVVRFYVTHSSRTITMHTEGAHLSEIITTFSTGITSINGLTEQTQVFTTATTGTDFSISSTGSTHTFAIPDASATARGLITASAQTLAGIKTFGNGVSAGEIRLLEPSGDGTNYVAVKSQAITADYSITLPPAAPTAAQYLQSTGTGGVLQWTSGTTTGVSSIGTINSATKNPNGAVISGSNIIMQTADATNVGLVSIGTQTFAGAKTFSDAVTTSGVGSQTTPAVAIANSTIAWMSFTGAPEGNPALSAVASRSAGTRIVLRNTLSITNPDYAIGCGSNSIWHSAPQRHEFYTLNTTLNNVGTFGTQGLTLGRAGSQTNANLLINSSTIQWMSFGLGANNFPTITGARSTGTKIVLADLFLAGSRTDHAIGLGANTQWYSVPDSTYQFQWYERANTLMTLSGAGVLTLTGTLALRAGAAAAGSSPLTFTSGTNLTTAVNGAMEYNGTNLFFTRTGAVREGVLTQSAVTTEVLITNTSITVNIGGTTYKILARA